MSSFLGRNGSCPKSPVKKNLPKFVTPDLRAPAACAHRRDRSARCFAGARPRSTGSDPAWHPSCAGRAPDRQAGRRTGVARFRNGAPQVAGQIGNQRELPNSSRKSGGFRVQGSDSTPARAVAAPKDQLRCRQRQNGARRDPQRPAGRSSRVPRASRPRAQPPPAARLAGCFGHPGRRTDFFCGKGFFTCVRTSAPLGFHDLRKRSASCIHRPKTRGVIRRTMKTRALSDPSARVHPVAEGQPITPIPS